MSDDVTATSAHDVSRSSHATVVLLANELVVEPAMASAIRHAPQQTSRRQS